MEYQKIILPKAVCYLTQNELHHLLLSDIELYKESLARGKKIGRYEVQKSREQAKWDTEKGFH